MKPQLTTEALRTEAATFAEEESTHEEPTLYGVTDGKAVGTYLEHKFQALSTSRRLRTPRGRRRTPTTI